MSTLTTFLHRKCTTLTLIMVHKKIPENAAEFEGFTGVACNKEFIPTFKSFPLVVDATATQNKLSIKNLHRPCCCCYPILSERWGHGGRPRKIEIGNPFQVKPDNSKLSGPKVVDGKKVATKRAAQSWRQDSVE